MEIRKENLIEITDRDKFLNFLSDNDALTYYKQVRTGLLFRLGVDKFLERTPSTDFISGAFSWSSNQNPLFNWYELHEKWLRELRQER